MNIEITRDVTEPVYLQLYRQLAQDIAEGVYPAGSRLPSKRTIAEESGVSVITVEHAIELLCEEGYAESRERSGTFVIYRDEDFLASGRKNSPEEWRPGGPAHILPSAKPAAAVSHPDFEFPYSVLARTMRRVLSDYEERILVKSPNHGCEELRQEICRYLARSKGIHVDPSQVIIGSGAEYLYGLIIQLLGEDKIYGIEEPSYRKIRLVYETMGARCEGLPLRQDGVDSRALEQTAAQVLHVTPFHSFPSGISADVSKKKEYLRWASRRQAVLIEDNYDSELTVSKKAEEPLFSMDREGRGIYLNTFSKTIAPSMRIGYMILPMGMVEEFREKLGFYSCTVPVFEQYVLAELLKSGDFERHINRVRRKRRQTAREKDRGQP